MDPAALRQAQFGTIIQRNYPPLSTTDEGYWWCRKMVEEGFVSPTQANWELDRIPFLCPAPGALFISKTNTNGETSPTHVTRRNGTVLPLNDHLGQGLRDYIILLVNVPKAHNLKIINSTFPLSTIRRGEPVADIVDKIRGH